ncbi:hypothetical protein N7510_009839 [Penicillium lagena]|uniref:uncharacterized protein n=1 Tax=Penicillium lagena TaxID=94218 RepID=UPI002540C709|nr:uncharacterized protein N7510_009839 [Penicillium lagena]KAJ5604685.1 hypothetical protein N7510_009839 [Penicillium lagena]
MAEPLSTTASVIGIIAPALHGIRLLLDDIQNIKDAPDTIQALNDHLYRVSLALSSLQGVEPEEWESLGSSVADQAKSTIQFCTTTCDRFRADLKRWTSHSHGGSFSWRDRAKVGFVKQGEIKSIQRQLQNCQVTINSVISIATLYCSFRRNPATEEIKEAVSEAISRKRGEISSAANTTDSQLVDVTDILEKLIVSSDVQDTEEETVQMSRQLREEKNALRCSRDLLAKLFEKAEEDTIRKATAQNQEHFPRVTFGGQNTGFQIGVNNGPISGITFGVK